MPVIVDIAGPRFVQNAVNQSVVAPSSVPCKVVVVASDSDDSVASVVADSDDDSVVSSADDEVSGVTDSELVTASELVVPAPAAELDAAVVAAVAAAVGVPAELLPQAARATAAATATPINPVRLIEGPSVRDGPQVVVPSAGGIAVGSGCMAHRGTILRENCPCTGFEEPERPYDGPGTPPTGSTPEDAGGHAAGPGPPFDVGWTRPW